MSRTQHSATPTPGQDPAAAQATVVRDGQAVVPGHGLVIHDPDLGASTVEYAIVLLAAAAFGGVMAAVIASDAVSELLMGIISKALGI
ncbi:DUF4244 domain-containing protein [Kocuria coralli]|uniref:DUF4244 domain-containing protein n=1 Tax=Kocuria coralli TaxID=1461025 RepID=A0A5J5L037_9MICC|nr:DUF4244 domain-containing protein [Kocuria coralli]KAA9395309.1 DUF4244 domain-containing protein [Kocuria coralli]